MWNQFYYGVCYYPEHWPVSRHKEDIERIARAGFNLVRLGEGAWAYWEPAEGKYQFEMFDRVIDLCRKHGVKVIMGTPTYCAPAWVAHNYPEVLRRDFQRIPMAHGSRRNFNYTSPKYLDLSDRICTAMAAHYKGEKQIIAWQLDNELNCHMDVSYAESDTVAFRAWLKAKYRTLDRLNEVWGTRFWSQTYSEWEQIDLPHPTPTYMNPTQRLDESRFISDMVVRFAGRQAAILRKHNPKWLITHNGLFSNVKGTDLMTVLDGFSHDQYPLFGTRWTDFAANLQQARSLSFPYAILEQQSGPGGQVEYFLRTARPGEMRLWAWQSILHGAKVLEYFRWRTCPYGAEQHWHGLIDPDNRDNRRLVEAVETGKETRKLPAGFFAAPPVKMVAVLRDFDNEVNDYRINIYNREGRGEANRWLAELGRRHIPADLAWPETDLAGYKVLIAPHLRIMPKSLATKLTKFVRAGGTLVLGAQSGLKNENCHLVEMPLPGLLAKLAGVEIEDWSTLPEKETRDARLSTAVAVQFNTFIERLRLRGAEPVAWWAGGDSLIADAPAITRHRVGKGTVYYIGGYCPAAAVSELAEFLAGELSLRPVIQATGDVEAILRATGRRQWLCLLNHSKAPQRVAGLASGRDLISGAKVAGEVVMAPLGVAVIESRG